MSKAKTNSLDALRALIAERQQYEQWMTALEAKKEGTPEHVFERVQGDYRGRFERVVTDIQGHAQELQLSISTLSSRLVEVARDEDTRREGLQEAELRAAVGEYEPDQWEQLRVEAERDLEKAAADRASLDAQLGELRAIQKLSETGSGGTVPSGNEAAATPEPALGRPVRQELTEPAAEHPFVSASAPSSATPPPAVPSAPATQEPPNASNGASTLAPSENPAAGPPEKPRQEAERLPLTPVAAAASAATAASQRPRSSKTPPGGVSASRRSEAAKPDQSKTLKCPECGTPNYATEWYCERCGGELATM